MVVRPGMGRAAGRRSRKGFPPPPPLPMLRPMGPHPHPRWGPMRFPPRGMHMPMPMPMPMAMSMPPRRPPPPPPPPHPAHPLHSMGRFPMRARFPPPPPPPPPPPSMAMVMPMPMSMSMRGGRYVRKGRDLKRRPPRRKGEGAPPDSLLEDMSRPWITDAIRAECAEKRRLSREARETRDEGARARFRAQRDKCNRLVREARRRHIDETRRPRPHPRPSPREDEPPFQINPEPNVTDARLDFTEDTLL